MDSSIATSWEIATQKYHMELQNGKKVKVIDEGIFLGHCLLASHVNGAYSDSCLLEVASENNDTELIEALNKDILEVSYKNVKKEDEQVAIEKTEPITDISTEKVEETPVETITEPDTSMLTEFDLRKALRESISDKLGKEKWDFYIVYHFPADKVIWVQMWDSSELDVITFTYEVTDDVVTVSEPVMLILAPSGAVAMLNVFASM